MHLEPWGPKPRPYLLGHGSDAPVFSLRTGRGGGGCHSYLAAFPTQALGATVEAAQQVLGRKRGVHCMDPLHSAMPSLGLDMVPVPGTKVLTHQCLSHPLKDSSMTACHEEAGRTQSPPWRGIRALRKERTLRSVCLCPAVYLHWLQGGRKSILQGAAGKPPHFLSEHRARCHENVPAKRCLESIHFIATKFRPSGCMPGTCLVSLPVSCLLKLFSKPF
jgi:hypothetical protein